MTRPPEVLVELVRSGVREGVHVGHAVIVGPDGALLRSWGDPEHLLLPRSSNKPFQAQAMLECGLAVEDPLLALACGSHAGEDFHCDGAASVLASVGLDETALQNPASYPLDPVERDVWIRDGRVPTRLAWNCSGKHAAMLATCVGNSWSIDDYLDPTHPLQEAIVRTFEDLTGEPVWAHAVDGCGAPLLGTSLTGLARAMSRQAQAEPGSPGARVVDAMRAFPEWVGGTRLDVTAFMRAVPGLVAKNGAEGVYVAALPDGRGLALKIEDGADRARIVGFAGLLAAAGVRPEALDGLLAQDLSGGDVVVGQVRPVLR
jgi:L-asparaginase II